MRTDARKLDVAGLARLEEIDRHRMVHAWARQDEHEPEIIVRAEGNYVWDARGRRYLDFTSQKGYANIGHGNRRVQEAIAAHAADPVTVYGTGKVLTLELADRILSLVPGAYERVFFACNGSDAVEAALKTARFVTGKQNVISFWYGYHGSSMGAVSVTNIPALRSPMGQPVPGSIFVPSPYAYRSPFAGRSQEETDTLAVEYLRKAIDAEGPETIAAVIGEPVLASGGGVVPGPRYWQQVRAVCDEYGLLLIGDEVVTGFGRTGHWFARDHYEYRPDIMVLGKGMTSGYLPLSAVLFSGPVAEAIQSRMFPHGLTYASHALCCAAAMANLDVIEEDDLVERGRQSSILLTKRVEALAAAHLCIGDVRQLGLFSVIELVRNRQTREQFGTSVSLESKDEGRARDASEQVAALMRRGGIRVDAGTRMAQGLVWLLPPLTIEAQQIEETVDQLDTILSVLDNHVDT